MKLAILDAFTYSGSGGNPAGVVILDKPVSEDIMQAIAFKAGMSETAFVIKNDGDSYDVRFFTPKCEVDLCGHASIASFYYLGMNMPNCGSSRITLHQNTKAGRLDIELNFKDDMVDYVTMQQARPTIYGELIGDDKEIIAKSLNMHINDIGLSGSDINPTIVSTGLKDIIIPVKNRQILNDIKADMNMISDMSNTKKVVGYHVFTIENNQVYARNFAPLVGIDEECATGTSNGALVYLLYINKLCEGKIKVIQGESMNKKSLIYAEIRKSNINIDVMVGGTATLKQICYINIDGMGGENEN